MSMNDEDRRLKNSFEPPDEKPSSPTLKESLNDLWLKWKDSSAALKVFVAFALVLVVFMFIQAYETDVEESPPTTTEALWFGHYPLEEKQRFEALEGCRDLQTMFDVVDNARDAYRRNFGSNGAEILGYLDGRMESEGCYD